VSEAAHIGRVAPAPHGPIGRLLEAVCGAVAMLGGLLLIAIMLISSLSVMGRALSLLGIFVISGILLIRVVNKLWTSKGGQV